MYFAGIWHSQFAGLTADISSLISIVVHTSGDPKKHLAKTAFTITHSTAHVPCPTGRF